MRTVIDNKVHQRIVKLRETGEAVYSFLVAHVICDN